MFKVQRPQKVLWMNATSGSAILCYVSNESMVFRSVAASTVPQLKGCYLFCNQGMKSAKLQSSRSLKLNEEYILQ